MGKMRKIIFIIVIMIITVISADPGEVSAQQMSSQNFRIEGGNFNMTSGNKESQNFKLSDVVGQTAAGIFASKGYIIQAGFLNGAAGTAISLSVYPAIVDFGALIPNNPVEKSLRITISNGNATGYTVRVSENQPLTTLAGAEITDTVCDSKKPCSLTQAASWGKSQTGFGYRVSGRTTPQDFEKENFYRPFPASRRNEQAALVMQSQAKRVIDQANMALRLLVDQNQPVGQYRNVLSFSALVGI